MLSRFQVQWRVNTEEVAPYLGSNGKTTPVFTRLHTETGESNSRQTSQKVVLQTDKGQAKPSYFEQTLRILTPKISFKAKKS